MVASAGVFLILVAFVLNLGGRMPTEKRPYQLLNLVGAALACGASVAIGFYPFVIMEGVWALAAATALVRGARRATS